MKVVLNPKHFHLRTKPEDGSIWLTHEKYRHPINPIKDVTNDILLNLCADLSAQDGIQRIERSVKFSDGWRCQVTVEVLPEEENDVPEDV